MSNVRINGPCSACGDGDTAMKYHNHDADSLTTAANTAWLEYARGTWSETDRRIFLAGWEARMRHFNQLAEDYKSERNTDDCCHFQD